MGDGSWRQGHIDCEVRDIEKTIARVTKTLEAGGREIMEVRSIKVLKARIPRTKEASHKDQESQEAGRSWMLGA